MWCGRVIGAVAVLCALAHAQDGSRTVVIEQGPVRGYKDPGGGLYVFYNIPYATAPTGKDRYKAPLAAPAWVTVREAVDRDVVCPQMLETGSGRTMQEDCLIANVFVPDTDEKNLPVVVMVHGGGYLIGSGNGHLPKDMVRENNIIYVTFNYRLGVHGFLCLGTEDVPGNAGMKDMVALLRWVQKNIASFGGNPDDVTIDGYSSGSSAVDLLLVSKATKGLFHKAIPESGSNVAMWSVQIDPIAHAKEFAKDEHGFESGDDVYALEEFYKTLPYDEMYKSGMTLMYNSSSKNILFQPCVERDTGVEKFLDDSPVNILKSGDYNKVPMLYGFTDMEGLLRVGDTVNYRYFMTDINEKFSDYLPNDLQFSDEEEREKVAGEVKQFYFGDKIINNDAIFEFTDFFTDNMFAYPTLRSVKLQVEAGNDQVYLYQFSYPFENPAPEGVNATLLGSFHCAQTHVVLDTRNWDNDLLIVRNITRQFWANFIKTGTPVPAGSDLPVWPAAGKDRSPYMDINNNTQLRGEGLLADRAALWDGLYDRHYRAPTPPPAPNVQASSSLRIEPALGILASALLTWFI
ncbi:carboxylesterase family domain-containing protein [Phthorimaea operculella]|nr:carboxylesterase family domain-containing protein [Phthorimaea operculella]